MVNIGYLVHSINIDMADVCYIVKMSLNGKLRYWTVIGNFSCNFERWLVITDATAHIKYPFEV